MVTRIYHLFIWKGVLQIRFSKMSIEWIRYIRGREVNFILETFRLFKALTPE